MKGPIHVLLDGMDNLVDEDMPMSVLFLILFAAGTVWILSTLIEIVLKAVGKCIRFRLRCSQVKRRIKEKIAKAMGQ